MTLDVPRVLLADDEETFRRATAKLLEQEGYRCDCAQDSDEASRLLTPEHDVLISDIRMPGNMQLEFLRDVRVRFPSLPVVLITGYPSVQTAVESLRLSCTDYLIKPVEWTDLRLAVTHAVKNAHLMRTVQEAREEARRLSTSLDRFQDAVAQTPGVRDQRELAWSLDMFMSQSFSQMAGLAAGIRSIIAGQGGDGSTDICRTMRCPRLDAYREALESTVEVLEKTKHAFRSKDLGLLRGKIEQLLKVDA
jgi:DNA-binding NtrC family response regulator